MKICPQCSTPNRPTARFCGNCRTPLPAGPTCPHCGVANRPQARRCGHCGRPLTAPPAPGPLQPTGQLATGQVLAGRYRIVAKVAQGGMGAVYQAEDARLPGVVWAVKEMSIAGIPPQDRPAALAGFQREADVLARLSHPNLARVTDRFDEGGRHYLVMEFVDGQTLEAILAQSPGGVDQARVLRWADQLCDVLDYLHNQNPPIIYRDMKPANAMEVRGSQVVKLIDFGIVRFYKPGRTKDTHMLGTPGYAAPEQYGKGQSDERTDIYALGVTLLQLLTGYDPEGPGHQPFHFPPARSVNPVVSRELEDVLRQALQPNPADRFSSAAEMRQALRACPGAPQAPISPGSAPSAFPRPPQPAPPVVPVSPIQQPPPQPAPRPGHPAPAASPQLAVDTHQLDLGRVTLGRQAHGQVRVWNAGGGTLQARLFSDAEWVRVKPDQVNANNTTVDVQMGTTGVRLNRLQRPPPDYRRRIRDRVRHWSASLTAGRWPGQKPGAAQKFVAGVANALGAGAGAVVQALVWLTFWHAHRLVLAATPVHQAVEVRSNGGRATIDLHATVEPHRLMVLAGWVLSVGAVVVEVVVVGAVLLAMLMG